jgi:hypothetical protein
MTFKKAMFVRSAIFAAVITASSAHHYAFAESTNPPPQTDTDGGGGGIPDGSGNGGSGDGGNEAGKGTLPPSCYVVSPPAWFPEGPPVTERIYQLDKYTFSHIWEYTSEWSYSHTYLTTSADSQVPIWGTFETWTHYPDPEDPNPKPDMSYVCMD